MPDHRQSTWQKSACEHLLLALQHTRTHTHTHTHTHTRTHTCARTHTHTHDATQRMHTHAESRTQVQVASCMNCMNSSVHSRLLTLSSLCLFLAESACDCALKVVAYLDSVPCSPEGTCNCAASTRPTRPPSETTSPRCGGDRCSATPPCVVHCLRRTLRVRLRTRLTSSRSHCPQQSCRTTRRGSTACQRDSTVRDKRCGHRRHPLVFASLRCSGCHLPNCRRQETTTFWFETKM
jgi:hypothetical protein